MENSLNILRYLVLDDIKYQRWSRIIFEIGFNNNRRMDPSEQFAEKISARVPDLESLEG
jgi:hypothetical protein